MIKRNVIKTIIVLLITTLFISCASSDDDQAKIENVVTSFYKALNNGDYKEIGTLFSGDMKQDMRKIKDDIKNFVVFKKIDLKDVEINGLTAVATVECVDEFGNATEMTWDLIKQNNNWRLNNFNTSKAQNVNTEILDTHTKIQTDTTQMPQDITAETLTENNNDNNS